MSMGQMPSQPAKPDYDASLQMWKQTTVIDFNKLRFLRYLVERGELEHLPAGLPAGEFAQTVEEATV